MPSDDILLDSEERMEKSLHYLQDEFKKLRTGRASAGLVENIRIECYGEPTPLKQISAIGVPEARLIVIRPYDPGTLGDIEKGILKSDLGITPSSDGKVIRLTVPPLSEERRKQLVSQTKHMTEEAKVAIRNVRRDAIRDAEKEENDGVMTEDEIKRFKKEIQDLTDQYIEKISELLEAKEKEILEI